MHTREVDRRHLVADLPEFELSDRVSAKFRRSSGDHPRLEPWPCGKSVVETRDNLSEVYARLEFFEKR